MPTTSFRFVVTGQPVSWNSAFRMEMRTFRGKGNRMILSKTPEAHLWQERVRRACERAKPADWEAAPQIRVRYWLFLGDSMDSDNTLKLINDGIAFGLGTKVSKALREIPLVNDKRLIPSVECLSVGNRDPWVGVQLEAFQETVPW